MAQAEIEDRFNNSFTQKFGFPKTRAANKVVDSLKESHIAFIKEAPFMVMATSDSYGKCDACFLRLKGFKQAGAIDPLSYPND